MSNDQKPATLDDVVAALQKNQETLEEIKVWAKINGVEKVQEILKKTLDSPEKITIYHLSDGRTVRDIIAVSGGSTATVSNYWSIWNRLGLMKSIPVSRGERFIKSFDLESYGIEIPAIAKKESRQKTIEQIPTESETVGENQND
ncbi:hypothetical protein [Nitrosarchaeum sp. AC2]|uniref:hypothetical protein n=1 Tax=Nitrosarchaeum sp. AC2 TaxID=2259673 RepID=UPI0015CEBA34|nr:hypothetical protein [Nitrosarchaeum sp. AC2]QLH11266.1 hypothetical protein DSQ20_07180 [Nitrosarchaeum sp. AC2]